MPAPSLIPSHGTLRNGYATDELIRIIKTCTNFRQIVKKSYNAEVTDRAAMAEGPNECNSELHVFRSVPTVTKSRVAN